MVKLRQVMHDIMEKPTILHKGEVESSMGHLEQSVVITKPLERYILIRVDVFPFG